MPCCPATAACLLQLLDEARDKILMGTPRIITQSDEARKLTAYHEGGHALVALYTPGAKPIHKVGRMQTLCMQTCDLNVFLLARAVGWLAAPSHCLCLT